MSELVILLEAQVECFLNDPFVFPVMGPNDWYLGRHKSEQPKVKSLKVFDIPYFVTKMQISFALDSIYIMIF